MGPEDITVPWHSSRPGLLSPTPQGEPEDSQPAGHTWALGHSAPVLKPLPLCKAGSSSPWPVHLGHFWQGPDKSLGTRGDSVCPKVTMSLTEGI